MQTASVSSATGLACRELRLVRRTPEGQERVILDDVSASFAAGSVSLVTGAIGSGKTTLMHILCTILRPTSGEVLANGVAVSRFSGSHRDRWRRQAGLALQSTHFFEQLSVVENVMVPLVPRSIPLGEARERALAELESFGMLAFAHRQLAGLSGGERQRTTLARALVTEPRFLFADEPTAHQDGAGTDLILQRLSEARSRGATVVVVSHDSRVHQAKLADQVWQLSAGRLDVTS